ncbi:MAG TPA: DUF5666 domain-containing protein [Candidatus Paceibacterota bacterium]
MKLISRSSLVGVTVVAAAVYAACTVPAFAQTQINASVQGGRPAQTRDHQGPGKGAGMMMRTVPGITGVVTAINGTTLTVSGHGPGQSTSKMTATTTYMVDASHATIFKKNATSTFSSIALNDRVYIQGTVTGTNVVAQVIRDGIPGDIKRPGGVEGGPGGARPPVKGNGQPVVAGTVSSVNGTSVTITTASNTSFVIDASNATVMKGGSASTASAIATGDFLIVQGVVNGSSVTASSIIDGKAAPQGSSSGPTGAGNGFFGSIGHFFKGIFGF